MSVQPIDLNALVGKYVVIKTPGAQYTFWVAYVFPPGFYRNASANERHCHTIIGQGGLRIALDTTKLRVYQNDGQLTLEQQ